MPIKYIFISDLHLDQSAPEITQHFLYLLNQLTPKQDVLYILGDLFEYWIGDDDTNAFQQEIKNKLRETVLRGVPIFIMHGNRDFFLGKQFFHETQCQFIPDEYKINIFGHDVLLMHGDMLCTHDVNYQKFRRFVRHPITRFIYQSLPLKLRHYVASLARKKSQQHTQKKSFKEMNVVDNVVVTLMEKHRVDYLIHGHTHLPNIHTHHLTNGEGKRIVLEAWHPIGAAYVWDEKQQISKRFV